MQREDVRLRELRIVIVALETGGTADLYGNVRNEGLIDGLSEDACIEVPVHVESGRITRERIGTIPSQCLALNRMFVNVVQLTVQAAIERNRDLVYQAALVDPNAAATLTTTQIVSMVDDLLEAHGDLIPEGIRRS